MGRQAKGCPERDTRRPGGPLWPEQPAGAREVGDPEESVESFPWGVSTNDAPVADAASGGAREDETFQRNVSPLSPCGRGAGGEG